MSDWDFLHDMHNEGYSAADISDAAAVGYAPGYGPKDDEMGIDPELEHQLNLAALDSLENLRTSGSITKAQYLKCKKAILK
jgi:hypothetical protein